MEMKHLLFTTIAVAMLLGCGESKQNPQAETKTAVRIAEDLSSVKSKITVLETKISKLDQQPIGKVPEISIHTAVDEGDIKAVKQLLAAGKDVNQKGSGVRFGYYQDTPLHLAARDGSAGIAEILIANGANVNAKNRLEQTPRDIAYLRSDNAFVELLLKHNAKSGAEDSINVAVMVMNIKAIKQHLEAGAELNQSDAGHRTPLMWAVKNGGESGRHVIELLLANGADVNATDDNVELHPTGKTYGWTALQNAAFNHDRETVELLIAKGADVNAKDINGCVALHWVFSDKFKQRELGSRTGHVFSIAKLLIDSGAEVNVVSNEGETPLDEAMHSNHGDLQDLILKHSGKMGEELRRGAAF